MQEPPNVEQPGPDEVSLWREYVATRDPKVRIRLIERYLETAHRIAGYFFARRADRSADFHDYLQDARLGLIEALDRYDPNREAGFVTFASYRIRGAILNGLERNTERATQVAYRRRIERDRIESVTTESRGTEPFEGLVDMTIGLALGYALEDSGISAQQDPASDPYRAFELKRLRERLLLIVEALPERERLIVKWHYFERMDFKLIGLALKLSKGRISQLHARALVLIRKGLKSLDRFDLIF